MSPKLRPPLLLLHPLTLFSVLINPPVLSPHVVVPRIGGVSTVIVINIFKKIVPHVHHLVTRLIIQDALFQGVLPLQNTPDFLVILVVLVAPFHIVSTSVMDGSINEPLLLIIVLSRLEEKEKEKAKEKGRAAIAADFHTNLVIIPVAVDILPDIITVVRGSPIIVGVLILIPPSDPPEIFKNGRNHLPLMHSLREIACWKGSVPVVV